MIILEEAETAASVLRGSLYVTRSAIHIALNIVVEIGEFVVLFVELLCFFEVVVSQRTKMASLFEQLRTGGTVLLDLCSHSLLQLLQ